MKGKVIVIIVLLLSISLLAGLSVVLFRNGATPEPVPSADEYTVTFEGEEYTPDEEIKITLPMSGQAVFRVSGTESYTVKVVSNVTDTSDGGVIIQNMYYIDGAPYLFFADDYTSEFITPENLHDDYFVIDCTSGYYSLENVLCRKWTAAEVTFAKPVEDEYPFKMIITSSDGEEIEIQLRQS